MEISGHTQMLCLIGSPVGHSGSPAMYNYSFQKLGLDYAYLAYDIKEEETAEAVKALRCALTSPCHVRLQLWPVVMSCLRQLS